jgi:hypothetical protein
VAQRLLLTCKYNVMYSKVVVDIGKWPRTFKVQQLEALRNLLARGANLGYTQEAQRWQRMGVQEEGLRSYRRSSGGRYMTLYQHQGLRQGDRQRSSLQLFSRQDWEEG